MSAVLGLALVLSAVGAPRKGAPRAPAAEVKTSTTTVQAWIDRAVAGQDVLPSLRSVQAAAEAALELGPSARLGAWGGDARWRALLPRLDVRFGTQRDLAIRDDLGGGTAWARTGEGVGIDVAARWQLDGLLMDDAELRVNRERLARAAAVASARERATKVYFERVEVLVRQRIAPSAELLVQAARLDGLIRALTGGRLEDE